MPASLFVGEILVVNTISDFGAEPSLFRKLRYKHRIIITFGKAIYCTIFLLHLSSKSECLSIIR
jgi:hypothetical protein